MDGVPPEGFKDLDCLPACFDFGYHLALVFPPLVLDDEELEVSIATKINNSNNSQILLYLFWNGVKSKKMNLDLTWTWPPKNHQSSNYLFQGLPGLFYTLKLSSKSLIWLEEYNWHQKPSIPFGSVLLDYSKVE